MREFLLERKAAGVTLIAMDEVRHMADERFTERAATQAELDTVVQLLQSRGLAYRLAARPGATWVLLRPERINQYGASIIQAARNHRQGIGRYRSVTCWSGISPLQASSACPRPKKRRVGSDGRTADPT